jgi:hypothetical protein
MPQAGSALGTMRPGWIAGHDGGMTAGQTTRLCSLKAAVDKAEACPEDTCAFWEPGGAALAGRCAFERLGLSASADLASWLLEIRERLEAASSPGEERVLRNAFHHLLNESDE